MNANFEHNKGVGECSLKFVHDQDELLHIKPCCFRYKVWPSSTMAIV